jgi:hypothetical protein
MGLDNAMTFQGQAWILGLVDFPSIQMAFFFFFLNFPAGWSQFSELLEGVVLYVEYLISNWIPIAE